jgi:hypothetical protein
MHLAITARTSLLIVGKVILDALARQVFRQRSAAALLSRRTFDGWQTCVRKVDDIVLLAVGFILIRSLFGFIEHAINVFFATRCKSMQSRKRQLFLEFDDALRKRVLLGFQHCDFGSIGRQLRHQLCNARFAGSIHRSFESEPSRRVNRRIRRRYPAT